MHTVVQSNAGKARVLTDKSKSQKNIRQAVNCDVKRTAEYHVDLAEHLRRSVNRNAMCYSPDDALVWES